MSSDKLTCGVAQIDCKLGQLNINLQQHLDYISDARAAGVELLLFPELSLTGYGLGNLTPEIALRSDSRVLQNLADAAGEMTVAFGFVEEGPGAQFYNACAAARNGQILHIHRKLNLPTYGQLAEGKIFASGNRVDNFNISDPWHAGLLICADWWNPPLVHLSIQQQATALLAPINSALGVVSDSFSNPDGWDLALRFYSMMYGTPIIMSNRVGDEAGVHFFGGSCIYGPRGEVLAQAPHDKVTLIKTDISYSAVRAARFDLPTLRDANLPLLSREFSRLNAT